LKKQRFNGNYIPLLITIGLFVALYIIGSVMYTGFFSLQVFFNLLIDNAFLIITALGETLVIISGGIDISVGSVIALSCMASAYLLTNLHLNPILVIGIVLCIGSIFGLLQGYLIAYRKFQPFIATLSGLFLARGLCYIITTDTIAIKNHFFIAASQTQIKLPGDSFISVSVVVALIMLAIFIYIAHYTKFGRALYAIGGNEQSARLMGLSVDRIKLFVYILNGLCSSVAGIVFSFYMLSGYGLHALALEMDAIAAAVIGGTLLTGGVGFVIGSFFGVLIEGVIQTLIMFQGTLNSWWTRIAIAFLLLVFIVIQRILVIRRESKKSIKSIEIKEFSTASN